MLNPDELESRALALATSIGMTAELRRHARSGARTNDASTALGRDAHTILKTLILRRKTGDVRTVGVILRGDERLDHVSLKAATSIGGLSFAAPDFVNELTGFDIGGVPPVAVQFCDIRLMAKSLNADDEVVGAGGHEYCGLVVIARELLKVPGIEVREIVQCER